MEDHITPDVEPVGESAAPTSETSLHPDELLLEFRHRSEALDARLDALQGMIQQIRHQIHDESQEELKRLAQAAQDMANGQVYQQIDIQAKGELGALVESLNTTLANLQQLDASVKQQSTQVPELAAQLDAITQDTEMATQGVMNRLDVLMNASDEAIRSLQQAVTGMKQNQENQVAFQATLDAMLDRATAGEDPAQVAQEILDFLFEHRMTSRLAPVDLAPAEANIRTISDEAFEILNTLQFQDITRQKIEKVVMLLKQFQGGLARLLSIFKINDPAAEEGSEIFEHRTIVTQDRIFETELQADSKKESVDDIIAQFKKKG